MIKQTNCNANVEGELLRKLIYLHDSIGLKNLHKINNLDKFLLFPKQNLDITFSISIPFHFRFRYPFRVLATPIWSYNEHVFVGHLSHFGNLLLLVLHRL